MIYITGDCHGEFAKIRQFCRAMKTTREDTIIILGDAGINISNGLRDLRKKQMLSQLPVTLFCIHGNHEMRPTRVGRKDGPEGLPTEGLAWRQGVRGVRFSFLSLRQRWGSL